MFKKLATATLVTGALLTSAVQADQWHMPTPYGDANLPTQIAYGFAEDIKNGTDGDITITVHSGASLVKHPEIPRAVRRQPSSPKPQEHSRAPLHF